MLENNGMPNNNNHKIGANILKHCHNVLMRGHITGLCYQSESYLCCWTPYFISKSIWFN